MDDIGQRQHVLTTLTRHELAGELPIELAALQASSGIGGGDLTRVLTLLQEEGRVMRGPTGEVQLVEAAEPGHSGESEPVSTVSNAEAVAAVAALADRQPALRAAMEQHPLPVRRAAPIEMRLTKAIIDAMHPEVVGAMVMAGCNEAEEAGVGFTLVVE